jgi:stage II sporulation protein AA (anti-sigma F factor antagonist)
MDLIEEAVAPDVTVVAVAGRLDTRTADQFSGRLTELLRSGPARVLIEGSQLSYISSAGFRALLVGSKLATETGGRLAVCGLTAPIKRVIALGGYDDVFETYPSREEALAKLSAA